MNGILHNHTTDVGHIHGIGKQKAKERTECILVWPRLSMPFFFWCEKELSKKSNLFLFAMLTLKFDLP